MRTIRWIIGGLVVAALFVLVVGALVGGSQSCPAISVAAPAVSFVGTASAEHGDAVTFAVDRVLDDRVPPGSVVVVSPGDQVIVRYRGGDERFIHVGHAYQVDAWGTAIDDMASGVQTADECPGSGTGTARADGTPIDTGLWTRDGIEPYEGRIALGVLLLGIAVAGTVVYRRVKHPRLTIDGRARR